MDKYEDVLRRLLNAQAAGMAEESTRRLAECHRDMLKRGLGGGIALQMVINVHGEDIRARGERFWEIVQSTEIGPSEDPKRLSTALKRLARDHVGRNERFPGIDQFAGRNGLETTDAQHAQLSAVRDTVVRDLDARIDAHLYEYTNARPPWLARVTRKAHDHPVAAGLIALVLIGSAIVGLVASIRALW